MRAFYTKTLRCLSLTKPSQNLPFHRRHFNNSAPSLATHYPRLSSDDTQILRSLSGHRLEDACHLLDKIPQRNRCVVYWTQLLSKYAKNGFIDEARALFDIIPEKNSVTYNAMLTGYVRCGRLDGAWGFFCGMPERNVVSWTIMLSGLFEAGRIEEGKKLFDLMPERNVVSWNSMVVGLIRNGDLEGARQVFDSMPEYNVISWNAMISGYTESFRMEEARELFEKMGERNVVTWTSVISGYCRVGNVHEGYRLFCRMLERNVVSWTAMIGGFAWNGFFVEALLLFLEMKRYCDIRPNGETLLSLAYACAGVGFSRLGKQLHAQVIVNCWEHVDYDGRLSKSLVHMYTSFGLMDFAHFLFNKSLDNADVQTFNHMISGSLRIGCLEVAENLFEKVKDYRDKVSWTSMINGYMNAGEVSCAFDLFREMHDKDDVTWTVMISGLVENELFAEATSLFSEMLASDICPPNSTYSVLLGAAGAMADLDKGKQIHCVISKTRYEFDLILENSLISMYAKCGGIDDAYKIFSNMVYKDSVSWNSMIIGFSHHGLANEALRVFEEMLDSGSNPNSVTFVGVLSACSHSGLVTQGFQLFNAMKDIYNIQPGIEHYICVINLLGRAGKLKEAEEFVLTQHFEPDHTIWGALLGACGTDGRNADVAELAAKQLLELDPLNAPAHIVMCNIYARNGRHREEHLLRKEMGLKGVKKVPGCSWVVVNGRAQVFLSGDKLPSQVAQMLPLLCWGD